MLECAILGDSLAVGVSLKAPTCHRQAIGSISSDKYVVYYTKNIFTKQALISIGSNDSASVDTYANMKRMRAKLQDAKVTWLLSPNNLKAKESAIRLAKEFGDRVLEIKLLSQDKIHPTNEGYIQLAKEWQAQWKQ